MTQIKVIGLNKIGNTHVHVKSPFTGQSLCGKVKQDENRMRAFRLDVAAPKHLSLCGRCQQCTTMLQGLNSVERLHFVEAIKSAERRMNQQVKESIEKEKKEEIMEVIEEQLNDQEEPGFYTIGGSHLYEQETSDSDIDVRGFHVAPLEKHAKINEPRKQVKKDTGDIDFVSHELQTYGRLLHRANPNVVEELLGGREIINRYKAEMTAAKKLVESNLPLDLPEHYIGMAKSNFKKYFDNPDSDSYTPTEKKYLLVIRALLGAQFTMETGLIEPRTRVLSEYVLDGSDLVDELIESHRESPGTRMDPELEEVCHDMASTLIEYVEYNEEVDKEEYRKSIDKWMMDVRSKHES